MKLKNIISMGWGALSGNFYRNKIPLNIMLSVTNQCFSSCSYCNIVNRKQKELKTSEIFSLIDQVHKLGCQRLGIWGGEPLIREDVGKIVDYAKNKGLFVTLDSNGYILPQKISVLKGLDHLVLSLDGTEEAHDSNREPGSFRKVMAAIEVAQGKIPLWTITVLTNNNLESIDFILEKARKFGFLATFQLLHHNDKLGRNHESLIPCDKDYKKAIRKIICEKKKGAPIASSFKYLDHILQWPDYKKATSHEKIDNLKCWAGKLYCNVDTDGSVYPCSLLVGKVKALNYLDVGFKKAFEFIQQQDFCQACLASCYTEYNYLYSLDMAAIFEWFKSMRKTNKYLCKKIKAQ
jgi:MoaA/NifB/PqqE/SkfB family radical SAM enzyme